MKLKQRLMRNEMFATLFEIKGNPRIALFTEGLWGIPYNLYAPYATLYMYALGVNDTQIGLILSVGMIVQAITALFGGVITDKLGRRLTTVIFDCIAWSIPCLIWCFAQNFWWFFAAAVCNGFVQVSTVSWNCLFIEDSEERHIVHLYAWAQVTGLVAVFFAPLARLLVAEFTMVVAVRWIYFFSFLSMTTKFLLLYFLGTETKQGYKRMEETKQTSILQLLAGYKDVFLKILRSPAMLFVVVFLMLYNIFTMVTNNFFGLYITQNLGVSEELVAIFPIARAAIMFAFILLFLNFFSRMQIRKSLTFGFCVYILSHLLLLLTPPDALWMIWLYTVTEAFSYALITPRKESLLAIFIDKEERSRAYALLYVMMIVVSTPFGWIVGALSSVNRTLPFILNIVLFGVAILLTLSSKTLKQHDARNGEPSEASEESDKEVIV